MGIYLDNWEKSEMCIYFYPNTVLVKIGILIKCLINDSQDAVCFKMTISSGKDVVVSMQRLRIQRRVKLDKASASERTETHPLIHRYEG